MASPELLPNAPIVEAILDVRVSARRDLRAQDFLALTDALKDHFPEREERRAYQFQAEIAAGAPKGAQTVDLGLQGYFFKSQDGLDIAQFRVDGFTLNRLRPYQSWEVWFPLFVPTWRLYAEVACPDRVTRIAARCINHIPVPPHGTLAQYLTNPPAVPRGLPDVMSNFVMTVALRYSHDPDLGLNLTQALEGTGEGAMRLIVDVDAFRTGDLGTNEILDRFEQLRLLRDSAFFESITDDTKDLFR